MTSRAPLQEFLQYFRDLAAEARGLAGLGPAAARAFLWRHRATILCALALAAVFEQIYFWSGRRLLESGALFLDNALFGFDSPRAVLDITARGENKRSNVHPLFILWAKPMGLFFREWLGLTQHTAAIAVSSFVSAFNVAAVLVLLRVMGAALAEAALFAAVFGASAAPYFLGAIPETGCFSILTIIFIYLAAALTLRQGARSEWMWVFSGIFTYGNAITNFLKNGFAYFLAKRDRPNFAALTARAAAYGALVIAVCLALTLALGSSLDLWRDRWVVTPSERGEDLPDLPAHLAKTFFAYVVVAPQADFAVVKYEGKSGIVSMDGPIVRFNSTRYGPGGGLLVAAWLAILASGVVLALKGKRPEDLRLLALAGASLAFDLAFFSRYYVAFEGVFVWAAHYVFSVFFPAAFLAAALSRAPKGPRMAARAGLAAFAAGLAANNIALLMTAARLIEEWAGKK